MSADSETQITSSEDGTGTTLTVSGPLTIHALGKVVPVLRGVGAGRSVAIDLAAVTRLDTAGGWALLDARRRIEATGGTITIRNARPEAASLLERVDKAWPVVAVEPPHKGGLADLAARVGQAVAQGAAYLLSLIGYLGLFLARLGRALVRPRAFRLTALVHHCEDVGLRAVPIVALMSFLIGVVLAFQGASQLRQFGAEVFVVDLIAVSILRELGILLTAIIVAGRTASAFTAAIGSMKMREEIDAMRTLGLDPATVLFVPRILALLLMLPILGGIANLSGLFGGALMSWVELGISPEMFRTRLIEGTDVKHLVVGMVKAPVFALIIGVIGCHAGMQVKSNAESLGRQTSKAVVAAIFAVIVADAVFSVFFAQMGI
ncbi:ABC-type transport system [Roseibacterium elongatum DSM 19469]|uniref:ABC-type transport system n=1 Tax=Roseicyclus elongatus DSM 19469 TaxID=1294273 RepID=W8RP38_9RHOB|nr:MlaE family lipid ABC transporter permease subunit [Roseibacterium elongatum]AHM02783.1 ABC-type transport system [Roseibacterium elongatum DSM 19469]